VRGTTRRLGFFKAYPTVLPGSTVTLRNKFERPPSELGGEKRIDWDAIAARSTQLLSTVVSLVILSRQL
jgi:hypothetical protein